MNVTCTVYPTGTEIVGGESAPLERTVYVAGTRGPLAGGGATGVCVWVLVADDVVVFVVALALVVLALVVLALVVLALAVLVVDCTVALAARVLLCVAAVVDGCDEPPHPASSSAQKSPEQIRFRLTFPAYSADIRRIDEAARWIRNDDMHALGFLSTTQSAVACGSSGNAAITGPPARWSRAPRS
jgi:hypothetical protein